MKLYQCRPSLRCGLRYEVETNPGFEILGYADDAADVLRTSDVFSHDNMLSTSN
ncbi:MAG TPA: hypothetical protein PL188_10585 [Candidatus Cloacimonadota bacterium]|nr:hypothetical protein [Candidatus Cloacimonadota bacterium]